MASDTTTQQAIRKLFVLQDNVTGRFSPERLTWEQAQEQANGFVTVRRLDEVLEEKGLAR